MKIQKLAEWRKENPNNYYVIEKKSGYIVSHKDAYVWMRSLAKAQAIDIDFFAPRKLEHWEYMPGLSKLEASQN